jgi:hypothetical protein
MNKMYEKFNPGLVKDDQGHFWYHPWANYSKKSYCIDDPDLRQSISKKVVWITFPILLLMMLLSLILKTDLALLFPSSVPAHLQTVLSCFILFLIGAPIYCLLIKTLIINKLPVDIPIKIDGPDMLVHTPAKKLIILVIFIAYSVMNALKYDLPVSLSWLLIVLGIGVTLLTFPFLYELIRRYRQNK